MLACDWNQRAVTYPILPQPLNHLTWDV